MAVAVSAFTALARSEFMQGKMAADDKPFPAAHEPFTTSFPSTTSVETHTYMSNLPRLTRFKGINRITKLTNKKYTASNEPYRIGPVQVRKHDLDDDQIGGYMKTVQAMPGRAQKDIGSNILAHLAAGTTNTCFDDSVFFANSHNIGSGDNLDTANFSGNDGATHRVIALVLDNPVIKPVIFQDREKLSGLMTDAETPQAALQQEFLYWADCRFGLAYGFWWDAINVAITDTPTVAEVVEVLLPQIINRFRTFTLPKGDDGDEALYVHEGWVPAANNLYLLCNLGLGETLETANRQSQFQKSGGNVDNIYQNKFTVVPTSALGA